MRIAIAAILGFVVCPSVPAQEVTLASVDSSGTQGNGDSGAETLFHQRPIAFSSDGRFLAFESSATNLVAGDTNGTTDIFVRDLTTGTVERVSVDSSGAEADGLSHAPVLSADGGHVAFWSHATNLVAGDTNGAADAFIHDRTTGITERVSVDSNGRQGNGGSYRIALSSDGQIVAFESDATDLTAGDGNSSTDIFVRDRVAGTTACVSVNSSGGRANRGGCFDPAISGDGVIVAFSARATNLVKGDTNGAYDVFDHDRSSGVTERASVDSSGGQVNWTSWHPTISSDGRIVAFESSADNLVGGDTNGTVDVFIRDRLTGVTERVSVDSSFAEASGDSLDAAISSDGQFVAFQSAASNLVAFDSNGTTDAFIRDRLAGTTSLVSIDCAWDSGNGSSGNPAIPGDGALVAFSSAATDLVSNDTNAAWDVFVHDASIPPFDAIWANYGTGYAGTLGIPTITSSADPVFGTTISIDISNSYGSWTVGLLVVGLTSASIQTSAGGTLLVDPLFLSLFPLPKPGMAFSATISRDPALCGASAYVQTLELDFGAPYGIAFTPGLQLTFGH